MSSTASEKPILPTPLPFKEATGTVYKDQMKIGFLAGNDISTLMFLNYEIPRLITAGYEPVIYMAEHKPSTKPDALHPEMQNLAFYERYLTNNVIYPMLEGVQAPQNTDGSPRTDILYTPHQLASVHGIAIEHVEDINSPEFVQRILDETQMPLVVSTRCYQIGRTALIEAQKSKNFTTKSGRKFQGAIWNMHPGKLPEYQGILGPLHAMNQLQRTYAWTLHEMIYDESDDHNGIDKGPVINNTRAPIDYTKPAIELYMGFARPAADLLYHRIEDYFDGSLPTTPQAELKEGKQYYYSHPEPEFFASNDNWLTVLARLVQLGKDDNFKVNKKIKELVANGRTQPEIVEWAGMVERLSALFVKPEDRFGEILPEAIEKAVLDWEGNKDKYINLHTQVHPNSPHGVIDTMLINQKTLPNGFRPYMPNDSYDRLEASGQN